MSSEIQIKTERLQKMLAGEKLGGVLLNARHNFAWLTGGASNAINLSVEGGACFLLVRADGKKFLLANNIEMRRFLNEEVSSEEFEPVEFSWQDEKTSNEFIFEKAKSVLEGSKEIASDLSLNSKYRAIENSIAKCRYSLTDAEIERYRNLGKDAGAVLGEIFKKIAPGETELEIARKVENALAVKNINSVVTLIGADERIEKFRHPTPTANRWKKTLLIVVCARREGLIANLSRIACVGQIPDELQRKTESAGYIFAKLNAETKPGKIGAELYRIAAEAYAEKGFAGEINLHHQGGATGYKPRDWVAHPQAKETVFPAQAFAWNPSITGTKAEETILVSENGFETLTATPDFPYISIEIGGKEFFSPGILSL